MSRWEYCCEIMKLLCSILFAVIITIVLVQAIYFGICFCFGIDYQFLHGMGVYLILLLLKMSLKEKD